MADVYHMSMGCNYALQYWMHVYISVAVESELWEAFSVCCEWIFANECAVQQLTCCLISSMNGHNRIVVSLDKC